MIFKIPKELKFLDSILNSMIHRHDYSINLCDLEKITIDSPYAKAWDKVKSIKGLFEIDNNTYNHNFLKYSLNYLKENNLIYSEKQDAYSLTLDGIIKIRKGGFKQEMIDNDWKKFWFWILASISVAAFVLSIYNSFKPNDKSIPDTLTTQEAKNCKNKNTCHYP